MVGANSWWRKRQTVAVSLLALSLVACSQTQAQIPAVPTMTQPAAAPATTQDTATPTVTAVPSVTPATPATPTAIVVLPTATTGVPLDDQGFANQAFRILWSLSDADVADGTVTRSWMWGSAVPSGARLEPYAEANGGERLVEYFDKGRMEINNQSANPTDPWYVTSGLLTAELVTGRVQVGHEAFEELEPAQIPVAGDLERVDPLTPHYADFAGERLARVSDRTGERVVTQFQRGLSDEQIKPPVNVRIAAYDDVSGHNIADVFVTYFETTLKDMELDSLFVMGHPISEPYWISVRFGGTTQLVLVQLFERRALTYNPNNDAGWEVEFANIGLHYYRWRYHDR